MKFKTTSKYIKSLGGKIIKAGYCDIQTLLCFCDPVAYNCGVYGWNYDVYFENGVTICTGYRGMPGDRVAEYEKYEEQAKRIRNNWHFSYEEQKEKISALLAEFCKQELL